MAEKLRSIAMLSVHTCPFAALGGKKTGGMNVYVRELARSLADLGIEVDIYTRCEAGDTQDVKRLGCLAKVIHVTSGPERTLPPLEIYPYLAEFTQHVFEYQKKQKRTYQLIHAHYWLSGLAALTLHSDWRIPVLETFHTLGKVKNRFFPRHPEPAVRIEAEEKLVAMVDHLLVSTDDEQTLLKELYSARSERISVIPPGVDVKRFHALSIDRAKKKIGVSKTMRLLLFVGRLDPIKGLETLLAAIAILKGKRQSVRNLALVVIGGEGEDRYFTSVKRRAIALGIGEMTSFLGSRDQRTLPRYYSAAEATVIPSSHESFGLVALESMACATPVIASKVGGLKYLVDHGKTGFLVKPDDPASLADAIERLLSDAKLAARLGENGRIKAQRMNWPIITGRIIKLYESLI